MSLTSALASMVSLGYLGAPRATPQHRLAGGREGWLRGRKPCIAPRVTSRRELGTLAIMGVAAG